MKSKPAMPMMPDDYQAESDANTLMRAEEVKGDKKRHTAAKKHAKGKMKQLSKVVSMPPQAQGDMMNGYMK